MSSLTDAQRRLMEENRRRALERRAASRTAAGAGNVVVHPPPQQRPTSGAGGATLQSNGNLNRVPAVSVAVNRAAEFNQPRVAGPGPGANTGVQAPPETPFSGPSITATCVLIAKDRFIVDVNYNSQLVNIFKSIKGHQYDSVSRKWSFPLAEHQTLNKAALCLRPAVVTVPLPNFILKVFEKKTRPRQDYDLSKIDQTLLLALMPFQTVGVRFGISRNGRCLISDDMGLGKSIQALGIAHYYFQEWPLLIVCPSSMRYAWRESIWNWLPSVSPGSIAVIETRKDSVDSAKVLITSYDMLSRRSEDFSHCGVIIMDESHHLKNPKTTRTKAAVPLMARARRLILLSGTPALSRPIELFPQITAIKRDLFPTVAEFGIRYCNGKKNAWGWDFSGSSNMEELQLLLEETIMIRRLKSDVLKELPDKLRKVMVLDPTLVCTKNNKSLKATAAAFNVKSLKGMEKRGKLLEYYSETANAKLNAVTAYLKDIIEDGKKFICFAHHKSMMDGISSMLEEMETRYIKIDGSTSAEDRQLAVDIFQTHDNVPVALLSITAANSGITLTAANLVIFAELYWNPGILIQAEDRAHRIGQNDSVLVEYLVAGSTADDVLWPMIQEKLKVLSKAGLSKDNFGEANTTALVQRHGALQNTLDDFIMMMDQSEPNSGQELNNSVIDECEALINDQGLLDQLLDESFSFS